jgi:hypothetical protein
VRRYLATRLREIIRRRYSATALMTGGNQMGFQVKRDRRGNRFMDASTPATSIEARLPSRRIAEGRAHAHLCRDVVAGAVANRVGGMDATLSPGIVDECCSALELIEVRGIFKKPPCVPDLKPRGRDVAKDMLEIDSIPVPGGGMDCLNLTNQKLTTRQTNTEFCAISHTSLKLWKYAQQVGPAVDGAVTHPGRAHEKQCYADI